MSRFVRVTACGVHQISGSDHPGHQRSLGSVQAVAFERGLHRVHAAGVIADVAADRAVTVGRRIGREDHSLRVGLRVHLLVDRAGLGRDEPAGAVWLADPGEVP